jgi:LysM repeat protein
MIYRVAQGDTLDSIANKFMVSPNNIRMASGAGIKTISADQFLLIPCPAIGFYFYEVGYGDSNSKIESIFGVSMQRIAEYNKLTEYESIQPGEVLRIPCRLEHTYISKTTSKGMLYKVQPGETLDSIATKYELTISRVMQYSYLNNQQIQNGQYLYLPCSGLGFFTHIIYPGDSLYKMQFIYGVSSKRLGRYNKVKSHDYLESDQIIRVPCGHSPAETNEYGTYVSNSASKGFLYRVMPGDTLESIAKVYSYPTDRIRYSSHLRDDNLVVNQYLILPCPPYGTYSVNWAGGVYKLQFIFGLIEERILSYNNIENTTPGNTINYKIPCRI